jgi:hypothetical protein
MNTTRKVEGILVVTHHNASSRCWFTFYSFAVNPVRVKTLLVFSFAFKRISITNGALSSAYLMDHVGGVDMILEDTCNAGVDLKQIIVGRFGVRRIFGRDGSCVLSVGSAGRGDAVLTS